MSDEPKPLVSEETVPTDSDEHDTDASVSEVASSLAMDGENASESQDHQGPAAGNKEQLEDSEMSPSCGVTLSENIDVETAGEAVENGCIAKSEEYRAETNSNDETPKLSENIDGKNVESASAPTEEPNTKNESDAQNSNTAEAEVPEDSNGEGSTKADIPEPVPTSAVLPNLDEIETNTASADSASEMAPKSPPNSPDKESKFSNLTVSTPQSILSPASSATISETIGSPIVKDDQPLRVADFKFGETLGEGAYSRVVFATQIHTGENFAVKVMEKRHILKEKKQAYVKMERDILHLLSHPNIIELQCTFQDSSCLYFVLELCEGGELFGVLKQSGTFGEPIATFYAAEILSAMKYMHSKKVIHRDLKPENILVTKSGHIKIIDFGTARIAAGTSLRTTFCGTAEYVSPEVLQDQGATQSSDLWSFGCILFQFFSGKVPFRGESEYLTFQLILNLDYTFPVVFPPHAHALVTSLLVLDPLARLGVGADFVVDYTPLFAHPFFASINFDTSLHLQTPPPLTSFIEKISSETPPAAAGIDYTYWNKYLSPGEVSRYTSLLVKKRGLFSSKRRQLILSDRGRLVYVDLTRELVKGNISLVSSTSVSLKSQREFVVHTPGRNYYFDDQGNNTAGEWVTQISKALGTLMT